MKHSFVRILLAGVALCITAGCSSHLEDQAAPKVYRIATRQLAPDPTYNRLRLVHLPDTLPERGVIETAGAPITPLIHFEAKNMRLEQAAKVLADATMYRSYCASSIVDRRITLNRVGTVEELGEAISQQAGIKVVVDHDGQSVRFFPQHTETPKFFDPKAQPPTEK